jgi:hypothetical protein
MLVVVGLRRIDVAVAGLDRGVESRVELGLVFNLPNAQPYLRDFVAVVKF